MSPGETFTLSTSVTLSSLDRIRSFLDESLERLGVGHEALGDIKLAVDEAVTNIVLHGYDGDGGPLEIEVIPRGSDLVVTIRDEAKPFDDASQAQPRLDTPLESRPFGGMGLFLIRKMTDEALFSERPGRGNELRLVKNGVVGDQASVGGD